MMKIDTDLARISKLQLDDNASVVRKSPSDNFEAFFNAAMDLYNETNIYQLDAEKMQIDYVTGKTDDIIGLNMAQLRATTSLQFTSQITSKVLAAYQEIMRMQM